MLPQVSNRSSPDLSENSKCGRSNEIWLSRMEYPSLIRSSYASLSTELFHQYEAWFSN